MRGFRLIAIFSLFIVSSSTFADDTKSAQAPLKRNCDAITTAVGALPNIQLHPDPRDPAIVTFAPSILRAIASHDLGADKKENRVPFILTVAVLARFATNSKDTLLFADHRDSIYRDANSLTDEEVEAGVNETIRLLKLRRTALNTGDTFEIRKGSIYLPLHNALSPALSRPALRAKLLDRLLQNEIREILETPYEKGQHPLRRAYRIPSAPNPKEASKDRVNEDLQALLNWMNAQPPR